jgi:hypothetical protein
MAIASRYIGELFAALKGTGGAAGHAVALSRTKVRISPQCGSSATVGLMPGTVVLGRLGRLMVMDRSADSPGRAAAVGLSNPTKSWAIERFCGRYCAVVAVGTQYSAPLTG